MVNFINIHEDQGGYGYGNTGCGDFKGGGTKLERFLSKNQHTYSKEIIEF